MARFGVNPTSATGVVVLASGSGLPRLIKLVCAELAGTACYVTIYNGTALAGTAVAWISLSAYGTVELVAPVNVCDSVIPSNWFTTGGVIECNINVAGSVRVWGDVYRRT